MSEYELLSCTASKSCIIHPFFNSTLIQMAFLYCCRMYVFWYWNIYDDNLQWSLLTAFGVACMSLNIFLRCPWHELQLVCQFPPNLFSVMLRMYIKTLCSLYVFPGLHTIHIDLFGLCLELWHHFNHTWGCHKTQTPSMFLQFRSWWTILKIYIRQQGNLARHTLSNLALVKLFLIVHNVINRTLPAIILYLEYSFFLSEQRTHEPAKIIELTAAEYARSGTQAAVQKAVEDVLSQDHADDKELCKMIIDIILQNRMCGCHLFWRPGQTSFLLLPF